MREIKIILNFIMFLFLRIYHGILVVAALVFIPIWVPLMYCWEAFVTFDTDENGCYIQYSNGKKWIWERSGNDSTADSRQDQ